MAVEIGELRARLVAEATQMKQEIRSVKTEFQGLGDEGAKTAEKLQRINSLSASLDNVNARIELQKKKLAELKQSLESTFNEKQKDQLQEKILKTEASLMRLTQTSDKTAKEIWDLEDSLQSLAAGSQKPVSAMDTLDKALKDIGLSAGQINIVKQNLDSLDPTKAERQLEQLSAILKQLGVDSKNIEQINRELRETEEESSKAEKGMQMLASGLAALGAGAVTAKIVNLTKTLTDEANQLANSYQGLAVVANKFNVDASTAADLADKLADRWGLNKGIMADVVKTYTSMNLTLEETEKIIVATADAAAYNRQSHLSWDEAIKQVAEGIKSGNSNLTDAAGITTNLSVMQERYAKSLGTTAGRLTEAGKIQAAYNGMLEEGAIFAGNADTAMTGYTGTQAAFKSTIQEVRTELGEAFLPVIEEILSKITPLIRSFAEWASANKDVVAGATAAALAITSLITVVTTAITVVGALTAAFKALNITMGPVGCAIAIIGTLAAGVTAYQVAADAATESTWQFASSQEELNKKLNESPLTRSADELSKLKSDYDEINKLLERRKIVMEELVAADQAVYDGLIATDEEIARSHALQEELEGMDGRLKELDLTADNAGQTLERMKQQIEVSTPAMRELTIETLKQADAAQTAISEAKELANRYEELTSKSSLTKEQTDELASIVQKLTGKYPDLFAQLDEQGRLMIVNEEIIRDLIAAEEDSVEATINGEKAKQEAVLKTAKAALDSAKAQLEALQAVATAYKQDIPKPNLPESLDIGMRNSLGLRRGFTVGLPQDAIDAMRQLESGLPQQEVEKHQKEVDRIQALINSLNDGSWADLYGSNSAGRDLYTSGSDKKKGSGSKSKPKTAEELAREDYQNSLKYIQYKRDLNQMSEQQEIAALERLQKRYSKYSEIRQDTEVRIYKVKEQLAADEEKLRETNRKKSEEAEKVRFEASREWITQEERRMVLAGKSEEEIAKMKLEAWSRVRSRYEKDSEYYKQADTQLYNLRVDIIKKQTKAEQDAAKERETLLKDTTKKTLDAIDKAKKTELAALDDRRKAIQKFYDDQSEAIDGSERLKERNELVAEMEKYRYATSEKGQKHFLDLQEKLRKMDLEQQKRDLDTQRDQELESLDRQKQDIEDYYNDLREATSDLTGDLTALYKLSDDERLKSFVKTNELIKQEMANLQQAIAASQISTSTSAAAGVTQSIVAQMKANSAAWHSADAAARKRLEADNHALGSQIGATYKNGRWLLDGAPLYHSGGIAGEMNFRSPKLLMPDEIAAILKRGEPVLTPQQISSLVSAGSSNQAPVVNNYNAPLIEHSGDIILEDQADIRSYQSEQASVAQQLLAKGERAV